MSLWREGTDGPSLTQDRESAADHTGIERAPIFAQLFDVALKRLLQCVALGKGGCVGVVAALCRGDNTSSISRG
jgi:hypothetical protein